MKSDTLVRAKQIEREIEAKTTAIKVWQKMLTLTPKLVLGGVKPSDIIDERKIPMICFFEKKQTLPDFVRSGVHDASIRFNAGPEFEDSELVEALLKQNIKLIELKIDALNKELEEL